MASLKDHQLRHMQQKVVKPIEQDKPKEEEDEEQEEPKKTENVSPNPAEAAKVRRRPQTSFYWTGRGPKRTLPCLKSGCPRMFSRLRDAKKHFNYAHKNTEAAEDNLEVLPMDVDSIVEESPVEVKVEPFAIKDLRVRLIRLDDDQGFEVKSLGDDTETNKINRTIPCIDPACDKMFSRNGDARKHYNYTHLGIRKNAIQPTTSTLDITEDESPIVVKTEPLDESISISHSILGHTPTPQQPVAPPPQEPPKTDTATQEEFKCDHCPKVFNIRWLLIRHLQHVHGIVVEQRRLARPTTRVYAPRVIDGSYVCCNHTFLTKKGFNSHKSKSHPQHVQPKACYCNLCLVKLPNRRELAAHYRTFHKGPQRAAGTRCNWCEQDFISAKYAFKHKRKWHPEMFEDAAETQDNGE